MHTEYPVSQVFYSSCSSRKWSPKLQLHFQLHVESLQVGKCNCPGSAWVQQIMSKSAADYPTIIQPPTALENNGHANSRHPTENRFGYPPPCGERWRRGDQARSSRLEKLYWKKMLGLIFFVSFAYCFFDEQKHRNTLNLSPRSSTKRLGIPNSTFAFVTTDNNTDSSVTPFNQ